MSANHHGYNFFAIVDEGRERRVKKIVVSQDLAHELAVIFEGQAAQFLDADCRRIAFDPRFTADSDSLFEIGGYALPDAIREAAASSAQVDPLEISGAAPPTIKSIFAARDTGVPAELRLLFQKFYSNRLIRPGFLSFMHIDGTLQRLINPGLTLDTQLTAVYERGTLLFRSYQTVSAFLDLSNYFIEATNEDISQIFGHGSLIVEDSETLMAMCDSQVRKKFSVIKLTGILDRVPPRSVVALAREFDIEIALRRPNGVDRFVLPSQKKELKRFLDFLCERYFKGTLTQERYEANSHRKI